MQSELPHCLYSFSGNKRSKKKFQRINIIYTEISGKLPTVLNNF